MTAFIGWILTVYTRVAAGVWTLSCVRSYTERVFFIFICMNSHLPSFATGENGVPLRVLGQSLSDVCLLCVGARGCSPICLVIFQNGLSLYVILCCKLGGKTGPFYE